MTRPWSDGGMVVCTVRSIPAVDIKGNDQAATGGGVTALMKVKGWEGGGLKEGGGQGVKGVRPRE